MIALVHVAGPVLDSRQSCIACHTPLPAAGWKVGSRVAHDGRAWYRPEFVSPASDIGAEVLCFGAN